eukprot:gene1435-321_t
MALAVLPFSAVEVQRKGGSRAATLHAALDATILDLRTAANSDAVYLGEKGCVDGDLLSELAEFSRPRSDKALRIVVSSVRGDRGGSKEKVWLRNHVRGRSYGPVGEWLLARLAPLQVVEPDGSQIRAASYLRVRGPDAEATTLPRVLRGMESELGGAAKLA